ncbi:MAG: hypothetical protein IMZ52_06360 [Actinobacteria bacterium]|nr:hypothetical protein [Actinomycetota bacterium]MBE3114419.1 hypothetical protein [Actinomycetota bacterium]
MVTGLDYKLSAILSITFNQVICSILFVFLAGKYLFKTKVGLFASLLLAFGNYFINMGLIIIPNSIAAVFILIIIYLFVTIRKNNFLIGTFLIILFMISLIFTHTISAMAMAIILFVMFIGAHFYKKFINKNVFIPMTFNLVAFFSVAMFSWWIYVTGHINTLADIIKVGFSPDFFIHAPKEISMYVTTVPLIEQVLNQIGTFLFFSLSLIGCLYMISRKYGNISTYVFALVGITPLVIGFFSLIIGTYVIPDRWWYFSQILLTIPLAVSVILVYNKIHNRFVKPVFLVFLIIGLSSILIISPAADITNHSLFPNIGIRTTKTESEITSAAFFVEKSTEKLSSDYDYFTNPSGSLLKNYFNVKPNKIKSLDTVLLSGKFDINGTIIVIREEIINKPFRLFGQPFKLNYNPSQKLEEQGFSKIYDCNSVLGFYRININTPGI